MSGTIYFVEEPGAHADLHWYIYYIKHIPDVSQTFSN